MEDSISAPDPDIQIHAGLSRDLGLTAALAIGVGTMIAAGVFSLSGLAVNNVGSAAIASFLLAALAASFTALAYCEFSSVYPESGEGYLYARKTFSPPLAYCVGLALLLGYTSSCAFYIASLSSYFQAFVWQSPIEALSGGLVLIGLILLNIKGTRESRALQIIVTAVTVILLMGVVFGGISAIDPAQIAERFSTDIGQIGSTAGLVFIAFFGVSAIAASAGEVVNPEKTIPRAIFISMALVTVLYTAIVLVIIAANLTAYTELAMGTAATRFLGNTGGLVIIGGAILSMISASNTSIMAGSRVALSMSNLGHLPSGVGAIDPKTRTPIIAVLLVGGTILLFFISLPLEDLAHFAGTVLLLALIMVNAALIVHRRKYPDMPRPFRVPLVPLQPILGIAANIYLLSQILHHTAPVLLAGLTLLVGLGFFFAWKGFQLPEEELPGAGTQIALHRTSQMKVDFRVMVPIANPTTIRPLLELAASIARQRGGELVVLRVVLVPEQLPLQLDSHILERERAVLETAHQISSELGVPMTSMVKVGRNVARAILETARERGCDLVVIGWKGHTSTARRILGEVTDSVIRHAAVDLMLVKMPEKPSFKRLRVLLPTAGGDHARAAEGYAASLVKDTGGSLTVLSVEGATDNNGRAHTNLRQASERINSLGLGIDVEHALVKHGSVPEAIIEQSRSYDALVSGATRDSNSRQVLFGSLPEKVAQEAEHMVIVVKAHDPIKAFVSRVVRE